MPSSDSSMSSQQESRPSKQESSTSQESDASSWMPKPPKVLMEDDNATPLELRSQIQLYATNEYVLLGWLCILTFMTVHLGNSRILLYPPSSKVPWVISVPCISLREMGSYFAMKLYIWLTEQHTQTNYLHQKLWTNQSDRERIWRNSGSLQRSTSRCLMVSFYIQKCLCYSSDLLKPGMCHVLTVFTFHRSVRFIQLIDMPDSDIFTGEICIQSDCWICQACHWQSWSCQWAGTGISGTKNRGLYPKRRCWSAF